MNSLVQITSVLCFAWTVVWILWGGTSVGKAWYTKVSALLFSAQYAKAGLPLMTMALPLLVSSSLLYLLARRTPERPSSSSWTMAHHRLPHSLPPMFHRGMHWITTTNLLHDTNFDRLGLVFILIPLLAYTAASIYAHLSEDDMSLDDQIMEAANVFGIAALICMGAYLFVPVARHSCILNIFGWNAAAAIRLHVWSGRIVIIASLIHGSMHSYRWMALSGYSFFETVAPPAYCWSASSGDAIPNCSSADADCSCYHRARNLVGLLAAAGLLVIAISSLAIVRRNFYSVFYRIHIVAGPWVLIMTFLHWNKSILYVVGGVLYYLASSAPHLLETFRASCLISRSGCSNGAIGVQILSICRIPPETTTSMTGQEDRPCISVTFAASHAAMARFRAGNYVKATVPEISRIVSHPFTVITVPITASDDGTGADNTSNHQQQVMRILFRVTGPFTRQFAELLLATKIDNENNSSNSSSILPTIHLDGYHGPSNRVQQVLQHDVAVLVAGGIGITPYLSLLHRLHFVLQLQQRTRLSSSEEGTTTTSTRLKKIILHWICREPSLIAYVKTEYLDPLLRLGPLVGCEIQIVLHQTGGLVRGGSSSSNGNGASGGAGSKSGSSSRDAGARPLSQSYSDLRNPQDDSQVLHNNKNSESSPTAAAAMTTTGVPFSPSRFSPVSKTSYARNCILVVPFAVTVWISLAIVWYFYNNVQDDHKVLSRIWSPLFVVLFAFGIAIAVQALFLCSSLSFIGRSRISSSLNNLLVDAESEDSSPEWTPVSRKSSEEDEDHAVSLEFSSSLELSPHGALPNDKTSSNNATDVVNDDPLEPKHVVLEERTGRPTVHQLVNSLDTAQWPGLFVCGPTSLMKDVREVVRVRCSLRQMRQCATAEANRIALYEESFEM